MLITEPIKTTMTAVGGTVSKTFTFPAASNRNRNLVHLFIKPTTADTEYDFKIVDKFDLDIYEETGIVGKFVSTDPANLPQFIYGNITLTISNATNNELFDVLLVYKDNT